MQGATTRDGPRSHPPTRSEPGQAPFCDASTVSPRQYRIGLSRRLRLGSGGEHRCSRQRMAGAPVFSGIRPPTPAVSDPMNPFSTRRRPDAQGAVLLVTIIRRRAAAPSPTGGGGWSPRGPGRWGVGRPGRSAAPAARRRESPATEQGQSPLAAERSGRHRVAFPGRWRLDARARRLSRDVEHPASQRTGGNNRGTGDAGG